MAKTTRVLLRCLDQIYTTHALISQEEIELNLYSTKQAN